MHSLGDTRSKIAGGMLPTLEVSNLQKEFQSSLTTLDSRNAAQVLSSTCGTCKSGVDIAENEPSIFLK